MNPILRWAGSKRELVPKLRPYWLGGHSRYIEPFAGSACFFFALEPKSAVLGDLNSELIQTYRALKCDADLVLECFRRLPIGEAPYYSIRSIDPKSLTEPEVAARFLYLNRYCFNGLYRTNLAGSFNVPYGPPRRPLVNFERTVLGASSLLRNAQLVNADFETTLREVASGDFVYLDPPYAVEGRRIFAEYHPQSFTAPDLVRLGTCLRRIDEAGALFLVSYADSPEARRLFKPWSFRRVRTRRNIAGFAGARRTAFELVAFNLSSESGIHGN
jgi:DNA adenine methylase